MSKLIELQYNPGGHVESHLAKARAWAKEGARLVITDQQISAAGLMVLEALKLGVKVYYKKKWFASPTLYLHQTQLKSPDGKRWVFRDDAAAYGFPSPINGYRKVTAKELNIPEWKGKLKPDLIVPSKITWR